jgi:hypothetical protein
MYLPSRLAALSAMCAAVLLVTGCGPRPGLDVEFFESETPVAQAPCTGAQVAYEPAYSLASETLSDHIGLTAILGDTSDHVSKFGGQPSWLEEPQWPISRALGVQMQFIGQVAIDPELFPESRAQMAYIFATDASISTTVSLETWDPSMGESAVVLQPGGTLLVETSDSPTGPTVMTDLSGGVGEDEREITYLMSTERHTDPPFIAFEEKWELPEAEWTAYNEATAPDKIGGTPWFLQSDEFPMCGAAATLIIQFFAIPFSLNLADGGTASVFMNPEGTTGGFLFQSH